jgi:hypothetical protein
MYSIEKLAKDIYLSLFVLLFYFLLTSGYICGAVKLVSSLIECTTEK